MYRQLANGTLAGLSTLAADDLRRLRLQPDYAVHALRTRMKKIRSVIRLARARIEPAEREAISSAARDIKDAFGEVRNQAVMAKLRLALGGARTPVAPLKKSTVAIPKHVWPRLRKLQRRIAALPLQSLTWEDLCHAHADTYHSARRRMKRSETADPEAFHHWRKRVKDLYYQSLALSRVAGLKKRIKSSHRLGSLLGKHHDLDLLRTSAHPGLSSTEARHLKRKQASLEKHIFKLGPKLFDEHAKHLRRSLARHLPKHG